MPAYAHLSNGGVDLIFESIDGALSIRYWGDCLKGDLQGLRFGKAVANSDFDEVTNPGIMREHSRGWLGNPTISGHRNGRDWSTRFEIKNLERDHENLKVVMEDAAADLQLIARYHLDRFGILRLSYELINLGSEYTLNQLTYWLPIPDNADESLDFAGRWSNERNPQRKKIQIGKWVRDSYEGRSGHNFTIGQIALTSQTDFRTGSAWAVALAWSGNSEYSVEKSYEGIQSLGAAEILAPGEIILKKGESYRAPDLIAGYSDDGLDGISQRYHSHLRARSNHPKSPRPLTLNMWEAIYFDHSEERVKNLVDIAAEVGVERVVLDDGWFGSRRSDRSGLGDWQVSPAVWPNGLKGISDYISSKGMEFGLWFEGEMVNPDSDLYRAHPDWILSEKGRVPPTWRHQLVLDLTKPDAYRYILDSVSAVVREANVRYIKWDHNRTLADAGSLGRAAISRQSKAIYQLFDQLKELNPGLEIESCASGGGRIDLGMIDHVDRFWTSDNNDALERQRIQRWTMQFIPPELLGTHVGPAPGHQTGRVLSLPFRTLTALFGHAGIECDITKLSEIELNSLKSWVAYYKAKRELIHSGSMVRCDFPDSSHHLYGVVSSDQQSALFAFTQLETCTASQLPNIRLSGLAKERSYRVKVVEPAGKTGMMLITPPSWFYEDFVTTGDILEKVGLPAPMLRPAEGFLLELSAI